MTSTFFSRQCLLMSFTMAKPIMLTLLITTTALSGEPESDTLAANVLLHSFVDTAVGAASVAATGAAFSIVSFAIVLIILVVRLAGLG